MAYADFCLGMADAAELLSGRAFTRPRRQMLQREVREWASPLLNRNHIIGVAAGLSGVEPDTAERIVDIFTIDKACRVSLVNPSGCSCSRTDSLLGDNLVGPRYGLLGRRLRHDERLTAPSGFATALRKWLDGVSDALCILPSRLRVHRPFATAAIRSRLRLPGTCDTRSHVY